MAPLRQLTLALLLSAVGGVANLWIVVSRIGALDVWLGIHAVAVPVLAWSAALNLHDLQDLRALDMWDDGL